jgi:hypothetical protein
VKDTRLYAKFTLDFAENSKILPLSDAAFRCLVEATIWSRRQLTDGFLARRLAVAKWPLEVLAELSTNDPSNPSLREREEGWYIHDFDQHQDTRADIDARRERNKVNGQKGGLAKAKRGAKPAASKSGTDRLSDNVAETETGVSREIPAVEPSSRCPKHTNHTDPPPCLRCKEARQANEQWHATNFQRRLDAKNAAAALRDNCAICNGTNWIPNTDPAVKCNHQEAVNA